MNRQDLAACLQSDVSITERQAAQAIDVVVDFVLRSVADGESVTIQGLGVFEPVLGAARRARNPRTNEPVEVLPRWKPHFRASKVFRDYIAGVKPIPLEGYLGKRNG